MKFIALLVLLLITMCSSTIYPKVDSLDVYAQVGEENNWNIGGEIIEGSDLTYSIEGDNTPFTIIQSVVESDQGETTQPEFLLASALEWSTDQSWREEFAIITTAPGGYDIYYQEVSANFKTPKLTQKRFQEQPNAVQQCRGFTYFRQDRFVMIGLEYASPAWTMSITTIPKVGNSQISFMNTFITSNEVNKVITKTMQSTIDNNIKYILFGLPAYGTEKPGVTGEAIIGFYKFNEIGFQAYPYTLNQAQMRILLKKDDYEFKLIDFVVKQDLIYVLDYTLGPLVFQYNFEKNTLIFLNQLIKEEGNEYVAFDLNLFTNEYVVLTAQGKLLIRELIGRQQSDLEIKITNFDTSIKYSTNYIIISNKEQIIIYSPQRKSIVRQYPQLSNQILVNPYQSDFLVFHDKIQRYSITNGILHLNSQATPIVKSQFNIIAQSGEETTKLQVNFIILADDSRLIKAFDQNVKYSIPGIIEIPTKTNYRFPATKTYVGKLLKLTVKEQFTTDHKIKIDNYIHSQQSLNVIQNELTATIDMIGFSTMYKAVQYNKKTVYITQCRVDPNFEDSCYTFIDSLVIEAEITSDNFSWYMDANQPIYGAILNDKMVVVKTILDFKSNQLMTTERENIKPLQIKLIKDKLLVVWADKVVEVYGINNGALLLTNNEDKVRNAGYSGQWNPEHIAINQQLHPNLLFIVNYSDVDGFSILIFNYIDEIQLIKQIMVNDKGTIRITISQNQFMVVQLTETEKSKISIYSLYNYEFNKLKELELLKQYTIQKPLQLEQNYDTGISFLKTYNIELKQSVILVYNPNDTAFSTPFLGIEQKGDGNNFNINNYGQSMRLFINKDEYYAVSTQLVGELTIPADQTTIMETVQLSTEFDYNYGSDYSPTVVQTTNLINQQMELKVDEQIQQNLGNAEAQDGLVVVIPQNLVHGQVLFYEQVDLNQFITNIINKKQQIEILGYAVLDMVQMPNKSFLLLTEFQLLIIPLDGEKIHKVIKLTNQNPLKITWCGEDQYIIEFANNVVQQIKCDANDCQLKQYSTLNKVNTIQYLQCVANNIFVIIDNYSLQYYQLLENPPQITDPLWEKNEENSGFKVQFRNLVVAPAGDKQYLMLLADYNQGIVWIYMKEQDVTKQLTMEHFGICGTKDAIKNINLDESIKFNQVLIDGDVENDKQILKVSTLITTTKVCQFGFDLEINIEKNTVKNQMKFQLLRYGLWTTYSAHWHGKYVLVQYQSIVFTNYFVTALYEIPTDGKNSDLIMLKGGLFINNQQKYLITAYDEQLNQFHVLANQKYVTTFSIEDNVKIQMFSTQQRRSFEAINNYAKATVTLHLQEHHQDTNEGGANWTYIGIGIAILVCILAIGGYIYYRKKHNQTEALLDQ